MIGSSMILGMTIGATSAGKIISIGLRRTLMMCCGIGIFGVGISLIENFYLMILGRTIFGFACGIQTVVVPRYIEEYIPVQVYSTCLSTYCFSNNIGNLFALFSGLILPPDTDKEALIASNMWFLIFAFPLLFYLIILALLSTVVIRESPKFSLINEHKEECIAVIHQIYRTDGN